jgi:hypothetical protein
VQQNLAAKKIQLISKQQTAKSGCLIYIEIKVTDETCFSTYLQTAKSGMSQEEYAHVPQMRTKFVQMRLSRVPLKM